ncbi:sugar ABC transporter substrate-binding protein [Thermatribacter velox]|uniref:Sugar ABC transporter substrate-binding protein n=1 Tax=Thermatribacter velox TaxID=3039681 RepID=A0ABZ2YBZ2_9BACT
MKKLLVVSVVLVLFFAFSSVAWAQNQLRVMWAEYDGLTPEYAENLEKAFEKAYPDIDLVIISTPWNEFHDRLITYVAGGQPPDLSVIGTRWLLELLDMGVIEPIEKWLSEDLKNNIDPALLEGKVRGVLYGLPVAAGTRLMYYRSDIIDKPPETFEEMLQIALKINDPENKFYAVGMIGQKYVELTEYAYYLFGNGGYFFEILPDGSYGKCTVNDEAGVGALAFMNDLVNKYKVTQPGVTAYKRDEVQNLFISGNLGIILSGGFTATLLEQHNVPFKWDVAPMPHFEGKPQSTLIVTDSIVMFKDSKVKEAAGKFLDFFYSDEWRLEFDKLVGFPPVTKSLANHPYFQKPVYKVMIQQIPNAKGWPLMPEWPECNDIIWSNIEATFLGQKTPQQAMDDAAAEIDALRGF